MIRVKITIGLVTFMFLFLLFGLFNLEIIRGKDYRELGDRNCVRLLAQKGSRGKISDRNSRVIVDNKLSYDLMVLPQDSVWQDKTLSKVSQVLGKSLKELTLEFKSCLLYTSDAADE